VSQQQAFSHAETPRKFDAPCRNRAARPCRGSTATPCRPCRRWPEPWRPATTPASAPSSCGPAHSPQRHAYSRSAFSRAKWWGPRSTSNGSENHSCQPSHTCATTQAQRRALRVCSGVPVARSHSRTVVSPDPLAMKRPLGLDCTDSTASAWPATKHCSVYTVY